jgi:signal transduction histidine kinase
MNPAAEVRTAAAVSSSQEVMQTIAHELRQPLSAIESTAYYLGLIVPRGDGRAQVHLTRLRQLVEQSNWILCCGLELADDTPPSLERVDLAAFLTETAVPASALAILKPALDLPCDLPPVHLDRARGRALVTNVLTLFQQLSESTHRIQVKTERDGDGVALDIAVNAPGRSSESALGAGSALCLSSVRRTVDAHGGLLIVTVHPIDGVRLRIVLRRAEQA